MAGKIIVSACLLGENVKYNGGNNRNEAVLRYLEGRDYLPVCPEILTGLGAPRTPVEIRDGRIVSQTGEDLDALYRQGVAEVLSRLQGEDISLAILKAKSPTCGSNGIYDGTFTHTLVSGQGILAQALTALGIPVCDENTLPEE